MEEVRSKDVDEVATLAPMAIRFRFQARSPNKAAELRNDLGKFLDEKYQEWLKLQENLLEEIALFNDEVIDVETVLNYYLMENKTNCLLLDKDLLRLLKLNENPINMQNNSPETFVFSSYMWEVVLNTQFRYRDTPPYEIRNIRDTFIDEMRPYVTSRMDLSVFTKLVNHLCGNKGFRNSELDNFYEVPAILRVLAPRYDSFLNEGSEFYMKRCLQGLPHSVLMEPFDRLKLYDIPSFKRKRTVSAICL